MCVDWPCLNFVSVSIAIFARLKLEKLPDGPDLNVTQEICNSVQDINLSKVVAKATIHQNKGNVLISWNA